MSAIADFNYEQPTEAALVAALSAAVGAEAARALVTAASKKLNLSRLATPDDMVSAAEALMEAGDLVRVIARSQKVRAVTYRALRGAVD